MDDCLSNHGGVLHIEGLSVPELLERFGSPLFVVSEDQVRRNVRRFQRAFSAGWKVGKVEVLPAVKANWNLAVQHVLAQEGCGADVYSEGELEIALRAGVPAERISVNGVPKTAAHVCRTLEVGARLTIDSLEDVRLLAELAPSLEKQAKVRLRLRPAISGFVRASDFVPEGPMPTDLAALGYKGGLSFDEVIEAGRAIARMPNVELVGFHQHHGRHSPTTAWWRAQMQAYAAEIGRVCRALGVVPKELDIGGGYAIPRDPHAAAIDRTAPVQLSALYVLSRLLSWFGAGARYGVISKLAGVMRTEPNQTPAPSIEDYARVVTETLLTELPRHGVDPTGITLQLEPGRGIHGNAGVHLCRVRSTKKMTRPMKWNVVTVDTSEFWLTAGRFEHHLHDFRVATKLDAPRTLVADVTGRSCYADRLLSAVRLPEVSVGDAFAFLDTGAYQEGSASNFNAMPRPATVMVRGGEAFVIKAAETMDDVLSRERVPEHLQPAVAPRTPRRRPEAEVTVN